MLSMSLNTAFCRNGTQIDRLPDSLLLEIFSKLDFKDLCKCSLVCQRWRKISKDFSLNRCIILRAPMKERKFGELVKNHFSHTLEEFRLEKVEGTNPIWATMTVPSGVMHSISKRSHRLKRLYLFRCNLSGLSSDSIPLSLEHLSTRDCHLMPQLFLHSEIYFPHLTCLDLHQVHNSISSEDLRLVAKMKSLKALYLEGCPRINTGGVECLERILPQLEVLDLENTNISDEAMCILSMLCFNLKELFIGHNHLYNKALSNANRESFPSLHRLCIVNTSITPYALFSFMKTINKMDLSLEAYFDCSLSSLREAVDADDISVIYNGSARRYCRHYQTHKCYSK